MTDENTASEETGQVDAGNDADPGVESHQRLAAEVEALKARADENWEKAVRAAAEVDNLRKRHARELENAHKFSLEGFAKDLLQVRDSLELGVHAAQDENADVHKLREGSELTLKLLTDVMSKHGIKPVDPEGQPFDPEKHQAMAMQPSDIVPPNTVLDVVQKGYELNDRLIRPAMVMVSQASARGDQQPGIDETA